MKSFSRMVGLLLLVIGVFSAIYCYAFYDTSVAVPEQTIFGITTGGGRVYNIGRMQERQEGMLFGFAMTVAGGIFLYFGWDSTRGLSAAKRKCPYCNEIIIKDAKICRFCNHDLTDG